MLEKTPTGTTVWKAEAVAWQLSGSRAKLSIYYTVYFLFKAKPPVYTHTRTLRPLFI